MNVSVQLAGAGDTPARPNPCASRNSDFDELMPPFSVGWEKRPDGSAAAL